MFVLCNLIDEPLAPAHNPPPPCQIYQSGDFFGVRQTFSSQQSRQSSPPGGVLCLGPVSLSWEELFGSENGRMVLEGGRFIELASRGESIQSDQGYISLSQRVKGFEQSLQLCLKSCNCYHDRKLTGMAGLGLSLPVNHIPDSAYYYYYSALSTRATQCH
jgi:hypothetical protein